MLTEMHESFAQAWLDDPGPPRFVRVTGTDLSEEDIHIR
jgi:hypothetical protein